MGAILQNAILEKKKIVWADKSLDTQDCEFPTVFSSGASGTFMGSKNGHSKTPPPCKSDLNCATTAANPLHQNMSRYTMRTYTSLQNREKVPSITNQRTLPLREAYFYLPTTARYMALPFQKGSKTYSIFNLKCPRCHEGDTFETGSWSFVRPFDMRERCPVCDLNFYPEPGYYYGAMFISYIWTGWFSVLIVLFFNWYLGWDVNWALGALILFLLVNFVYIFRISRLMWININVRYDPTYANKHRGH